MVRACVYCVKKHECPKYVMMRDAVCLEMKKIAKDTSEFRYLFMKKYWIESKRLASECKEYKPKFG